MRDGAKSQPTSVSHGRHKQIVLALVVTLGFACIFLLVRWREGRPVRMDSSEDSQPYVSASVAKRLSLGFNGLVADWYWMRALQYLGRKMMSHQGRLPLDDLRSLNLSSLAPLLDTATTLDPNFMEVYEFGAMVLPSINEQDAIALTKKGIAANPSSWHLYQHLGYIYWQRGEYQEASAAYATGSRLASAPRWMQAMSARMQAEGGSRTTAREMYKRMYEESNDPQIKQMAMKRLAQLQSFDQRDIIRHILDDFASRNQ